jgi:hypothetical protein
MVLAFAKIRNLVVLEGIKVPFHDPESAAFGFGVGVRPHVDGKCLAGKKGEEGSSELHC